MLPHKVKTQYLHFRSHAEYFLCLGKFLKWLVDDQSSSITKWVSTISNICTYNVLVWKWTDEKFDFKWKYLLCFIFVDTACLLRRADCSWSYNKSLRMLRGQIYTLINWLADWCAIDQYLYSNHFLIILQYIIPGWVKAGQLRH